MNKIVEEARAWMGTPFHHQGRVKDVGCDCAGLVVMACRAAGYEVEDVQGYAHQPDGQAFMQQVRKHCDEIHLADVQPGDLMMFAFDGDPQHIAIVSSIEPMMMIHAYAQVRKVAENGIDDYWLQRLRGCFRLKEQANG